MPKLNNANKPSSSCTIKLSSVNTYFVIETRNFSDWTPTWRLQVILRGYVGRTERHPAVKHQRLFFSIRINVT